MLKDYLEQRHISLASGRSSIALEREYWKALETFAYEEGWHNWRDFLYRNILPSKPDDAPLANIYLGLVKESLSRHNHIFLSLLLEPRVEVAMYNFAHDREQVTLALLHLQFQQDL